MRRLGFLLIALAVLAVVATFALTYLAIFTDSGEVFAAAYVTLILVPVLGGPGLFLAISGGESW